MPYIAPHHRAKLDPFIDQLAGEIVRIAKEEKKDSAFAGLLNYTCTRLTLAIIKLQFGKLSYWILALVTGVFKNIADEFYRRVGVPYEDQKIVENGDVDLYEELTKKK